jgi:hypothetical protein
VGEIDDLAAWLLWYELVSRNISLSTHSVPFASDAINSFKKH